MITRVPPGTWETLPLPSSQAAGDTAYQLQIDPRLRVRGRGGTNHGRNDGIAKRRKRSAAKWAAGSRSTSEYRGSGGTNPRNPVKGILKLRFFDVCGLKGGFLLSADLGKIVVRKRTIRQPLKKEPPVLIMQDALPLFKSFLKPVSLKQRARQLVLRCVIAFLMHLGKMSASRVAGAVRTDARHRAQVSRFLGRRYWRRCDLLGQLRAQLLEMEARQGTFVFDIDQTYCSQQGKLTENTIIRGEKTKRPKKNKKKQKKYAQRSSHCFVMGLLITPSGMRLPFSVSYYTEAYCKAKKIAHRKQTELAAQLIRQLPLPPEARVVVLGDTAFDAEAIHTACKERKFSWIVPINPERVLAGEKPRPKVSSLSEDLTADQMVCLKVHPGKGKYVD